MVIFINKLIIVESMAHIISMSLNDRILKDIDNLQKEMGFSGRSETIRAGLRLLIADKKEKSKLRGIVDAVLLIIHDDKHSEEVSILRHKHEELIKTQIHNHLENHKCLEIFILNGNALDIRKLTEGFQTNRKIDFVKLIIS